MHHLSLCQRTSLDPHNTTSFTPYVPRHTTLPMARPASGISLSFAADCAATPFLPYSRGLLHYACRTASSSVGYWPADILWKNHKQSLAMFSVSCIFQVTLASRFFTWPANEQIQGNMQVATKHEHGAGEPCGIVNS